MNLSRNDLARFLAVYCVFQSPKAFSGPISHLFIFCKVVWATRKCYCTKLFPSRLFFPPNLHLFSQFCIVIKHVVSNLKSSHLCSMVIQGNKLLSFQLRYLLLPWTRKRKKFLDGQKIKRYHNFDNSSFFPQIARALKSLYENYCRLNIKWAVVNCLKSTL